MGKKRFSLEIAALIGENLKSQLESSCDRVEIVGSIRRKKPEVGDIELLCIPKVNDFGLDLLDRKLHEVIATDILDYRLNERGSRVYGKSNKLLVHKESGIPIDIFSTNADCWWVSMVIRTGSAQNNIMLAETARRKGWKLLAYGAGYQDEEGNMIKCNSETEVFNLVGLQYMEPERR